MSRSNPASLPERRLREDRRDASGGRCCTATSNRAGAPAARRLDDGHFHLLDWHSSHLLAVAICILLLCVMDAFLTLVLLPSGASEMNPLMAMFVYRNVAAFAAVKMTLTSVGIVLMVFLARYRFMRLVRVEWVLYAVLAGYLSLIGYEAWMLKGTVDLPIL